MWESETLLVTIVLLDFLLLSSARFSALVAYAAAQAVLLGLLVLSLGGLFASPWRVWLLAIVSAWLKGFVFPALLKRATRDVNVQREERPFVGFSASLLFGLVLFGFLPLWQTVSRYRALWLRTCSCLRLSSPCSAGFSS
jgi:hydrogenase-4 component E